MTCRNEALLLLLAGAVACGAGAPSAARDGMYRLRLSDGTSVTLVAGEPGEDEAHAFRYLPVNLTVARRRDGMPEFSFLVYRRDSTDVIEGGIMHVLLRWGLSESQEDELQKALRAQVDSGGTMMGAAPARPRVKGSSWDITSRSAIGSLLNRSLASSGNVPTAPGSKLAISFRFSARDAARMDEALRSKKGPWGEKIRFWFTVDGGAAGREQEWVLESDPGTLLPRIAG